MGFAPIWLRQVIPPASHDHFNHCHSVRKRQLIFPVLQALTLHGMPFGPMWSPSLNSQHVALSRVVTNTLPLLTGTICHVTLETATLLAFLSVNLKVIFLALPILPSHVSPPRLRITFYVTYGAI